MEENNKCSFEGCDLERYEGHDKCILHCEKDEGFFNSDKCIDELFFNALLEESIYDFHEHDQKVIRNYLNQPNSYKLDTGLIQLNVRNVKFIEIDNNLFIKFFSIFECVHFSSCDFFASIPKLNNTQCYYKYCNFKSPHMILPKETAHDTYLHCRFQNEINVCREQELMVFNSALFVNCDFYDSLKCEDVIFESNFLYYSPSEERNASFNRIMNNLWIHSCEIRSRISLASIAKINVLYLTKSTMDELDLNNCNIIEFAVDACKFNGNFTMIDTSFGKFSVTNCYFNDYWNAYLARFNGFLKLSNIMFGMPVVFDEAKIMKGLEFSAVSFNSGASFRKATIVDSKDINKETYCQIKNILDIGGNTIEANKYFALEMKKAYEELSWWKRKDVADKLLMLVNKITSDYGQKWWWALFWMLGLNMLMTISYYFYHFNKVLADHNVLWRDWFSQIVQQIMKQNGLVILDRFAQFVLPTSIFNQGMASGHSFINLIVGAINGILFYQLIVALKRKTRR